MARSAASHTRPGDSWRISAGIIWTAGGSLLSVGGGCCARGEVAEVTGSGVPQRALCGSRGQGGTGGG